jgi:hypothetical protein
MLRFRTLLTTLTLSLSLFTSAQAVYCGNVGPRPFCSRGPAPCAQQFWADAEFLYWIIKETPTLIPLVTQGSDPTPILDSPGTSIVLGNNQVDNMWRAGGKFTLGAWLEPSHCFGIEAVYLFLPNGSKSALVSSSGEPGTGFFGVPYFDVLTVAENAYRLANSDPLIDDGAYAGLAKYKVQNSLQSLEINGRSSYDNNFAYQIDFLGGFRYLSFDEQFTFTTLSPYIAIPTDIFNTRDVFKVRNNFYGAQFGMGIGCAWECISIHLEGKIAFGATCGRVDIAGGLSTNEFNSVPNTGRPINFEGGLFALSTNIGRHDKTFFTYIPEISINLGYIMMENLRFNIGYTFLGVSQVLRANEQIDRSLNTTQSPAIAFVPVPELVGDPSPVPLSITRNFWAQGVNVGLEFRF